MKEDKMAKIFKKCLIIGLGLVFFLAFYPVRLTQYFCDRLFAKNTASYTGFADVFAEVFYSAEEALKILLPDTQDIKEETRTLNEDQKKSIAKQAEIQFDPEFDKEFHFYIGQSNGQITCYVAENTVKGKWGPIHYMLALEPDGKIKDVLILELKEKRGRPVKEARFLSQFFGKTIDSPIKLNKDIKGISGATISSRGMSNGIRKLVYVFNEVYKK